MADHAHNLRAEFRSRNSRLPIGVITRGTTGVNRLRKCDRWCFYHPKIKTLLADAPNPLAIDLGYGASHTTTVEWGRWLKNMQPDISVLGLEIDPDRVLPDQGGVRFALGGFELAGHHPHLVRAFNVLRQYDAGQVDHAWDTVTSRLAPGGMFIEGTCDEIGRKCSWILLNADGPQTLTLAWKPDENVRPSALAERLPKKLIHRNVPGEKIFELLRAADAAWDHAAPWASFGPRVRWEKARELLVSQGLPVEVPRRRCIDSQLTVPWDLVAP